MAPLRFLRPILLTMAAAFSLAGCANLQVQDAQTGGAHPFPTLTHTSGTSAHQVHGIDVSKWQGPIDWEAARAGGVAFVFIKATEGGDLLDDRFRENWEGARRAGIPRGAYHFTFWCRPMYQQIEWFKRHVPRDPDALPPVLDVEWNFQSPTCPRRVPREVALSKMREFLVAMERHYGKRPIIYADIKFHREILANGEFADYPYWVRSVRDLPQARYPGRRWAFWQYTATGRVPGVRGPVDRNVFAGTRSQWEALVSSGFRAQPEPIGAVPAQGAVRAPQAVSPQPGPDQSHPAPTSAPLPTPAPQFATPQAGAGVTAVQGQASAAGSSPPPAMASSPAAAAVPVPATVVPAATAERLPGAR